MASTKLIKIAMSVYRRILRPEVTLGMTPSQSDFNSDLPSTMATDPLFTTNDDFREEAESSRSAPNAHVSDLSSDHNQDENEWYATDEESRISGDDSRDLAEGMNPGGFSGPSKVVKPLTPEALAVFKAAQERAGVIYISRIPPGMRPTKVRHLMSAYGDVGRVYLQQEGAFGSILLSFSQEFEIVFLN